MSKKKALHPAARAFLILGALLVGLLALFLFGRYGWRLWGFRACEGAGIEAVEVTDGEVRISGFCPGSVPEGLLGCYAEEAEGRLYVGFRFSGVFGFFETGDFTVTIPVEGEIAEVILKTATSETLIWPNDLVLSETEEPDSTPAPQETPAVPEAYAAVIGAYCTALSEGWDPARMMEAGLNYMTADSFYTAPLEEIGFWIADLDGDGTEELAIGSRTEDAFYGKLVFSLYTLREDGTTLLLFDSKERDRFYYAGGFRFANLGSCDWNESYVTTLKLEDREMIDMTYTTDPADYVQMELTPFAEWNREGE
ncbi:MAG: hypothetical protein ACI4PC_05155 [Oscillospiraceae bacterium]